MPKYLHEIMEPEYLLVRDFFKGNDKKVDKWFDTENPLLGMIKPIQMFYPPRRRKKLMKFIRQTIAENYA